MLYRFFFSDIAYKAVTMKRSNWLSGLRALYGVQPSKKTRQRSRLQQVKRGANFEVLEDRRLLAVDFGDAPDVGIGTGPNDYATTVTDNGPQHTIVVGLRLGANVDGDSGTLQNEAANADDVDAALPDDEDGLVNPAADLELTVGTQPTVNVWVTNTVGASASLYGWIDFNGDGVFDNATERTSVQVPDGTNSEIVTLTLPSVPVGAEGVTYARFRLSTDVSAANPVGAATDGEVEDYRVTITSAGASEVNEAKTVKFASGSGVTLSDSDNFGASTSAIGDLDGDGVTDLAVGIPGDDTGGADRGALQVIFLHADGTLKGQTKIAHNTGGGPTLANGDAFGTSVTSLGDLDGDGVPDLAVGAGRDDSGGTDRGAVHILFMNSDGTVKNLQKIAHNFAGGPSLVDSDLFGSSVASIGDLDGDGVTDLVVGAQQDSTGGTDRGAVHVLFLNATGTVKNRQKIAHNFSGGPSLNNGDNFGAAVTAIGDLDGDGVTDLAVGAVYDDTGGTDRGAVHVLLMNTDGTVLSTQKLASGFGGGPSLANNDLFGSSLADAGDLDGDGVRDLLVGAREDDTAGADRGAVYALMLNTDGTVQSSFKVASGTNGGPTLADGDKFGSAVAPLGDLDQDGLFDFVVGAFHDDASGLDRGAVYVLFSDGPNADPVFTSPASQQVPENTTAVMTVTASDSDLPPQDITFSIVGGVDASQFDITPSGELYFVTAPDFEMPSDSNGNNVYLVSVEANDGDGGAATQTISVTVTPVNDNVPYWTSPTAFSIPENNAFVAVLTTADDDLPTQSLTIEIVSGSDANKLTVTPEGVLTFVSPPDFDVPGDADGNNVYNLLIRVRDNQGSSRSSSFTITVTPVNDNDPVFTSPSVANVVEGTTNILTVTATDADLPPQSITFALEGGADLSKFSIDGGGQLSFVSPPDFDAPTDANGDNIYEVLVTASDGEGRFAAQSISVSVVSGTDFGDAPDMGAGVGPLNYQTLAADNGPRHTIVTGLFLGGRIDGDDGTLANDAADADNVTGTADDEDGVANPAIDLLLAIGTQPVINTWVTNTTGSTATLYGWIDYNGDGVFDNATERGSVSVPSGVSNELFGLPMPLVSGEIAGPTYARFRLSTDAAAANPTGPAADGEVEDHRVTITALSNGTVDSPATKKIASGLNNAPDLQGVDLFGRAVESLGDLDGDGVIDVAVGAVGDSTGGVGSGAVYVLFMNADGSVKSSTKIADETNGGPSLNGADRFGYGIASLGDLDADGVVDIAVGALGDDSGGSARGAVHVLFLNQDGSVKSHQLIASGVGGGPALSNGDFFGAAISFAGDLDGDGIQDLAVGASLDDTGGTDRGAVHLVYMNSDGTAKATQKIASGIGGGPVLANGDMFGRSVASLGDLNGDGRPELVVGATGDDGGGSNSGAIYVLSLNPDGTVHASERIASGVGGGPGLPGGAEFGESAAAVGDLNGDGVVDLAVGARFDTTGGMSTGAVHVLFMNADGTVASSQKLASGLGGGPVLSSGDEFGAAVGPVGDLNGDGVIDWIVGAANDDTGQANRGAAYILFLNGFNTDPIIASSSAVDVEENQSTVLTVTAVDSDLPPQTLSYTIVGGVDQGRFQITEGGGLSFLSPPDFEAPTDSDGDNVYVVDVEVADGRGGTDSQTISVSVTPVNDNDPVFTSSATANVTENTTSILTLEATDADLPLQMVSFAVIGGNDQGLIDATPAGNLFFVVPPDFESPADSNGDNVYEVTVEADDVAGGTTLQMIEVTVTPENDNNPIFTSPSQVEVPERTTDVLSVTATDDDLPLETITYSLVGGADQSLFTITPEGQLSFNSAPDFQNPTDADEDNVYEVIVEASDNNGGLTTQVISVTVVSNTDFGDAPDVVAGSSIGDYRTTIGDDGPRHAIVPGLHIGASVDGDSGLLQNGVAGADDVDSALPDDEDGLVYPAADLLMTEGTEPKIDIWVTNTTGTQATLYGWIDYNADGVFDSFSERASVAVPTGVSDEIATLTFPAIPFGVTGATYARFRLSTDGSAANSTGYADDGEIEDYQVAIVRPSDGTADSTETVLIGNNLNNGPALSDSSYLGSSAEAIGDLDGDGVADLAVGAIGDATGGNRSGAVHILFMNTDGTVKDRTKIAHNTSGGPSLAANNDFGALHCGPGGPRWRRGHRLGSRREWRRDWRRKPWRSVRAKHERGRHR